MRGVRTRGGVTLFLTVSDSRTCPPPPLPHRPGQQRTRMTCLQQALANLGSPPLHVIGVPLLEQRNKTPGLVA